MKNVKTGGHEGKPGPWAWPKSHALALTWAGLPALNRKLKKYITFFQLYFCHSWMIRNYPSCKKEYHFVKKKQ